MTDDQMHAMQDQRHREAMAVEMAGLRIRVAEAEAKEVQQQADLAALRAAAERARWCEEVKADVKYYAAAAEWVVQFVRGFQIRTVCHPDRDTAIDRAMQEGR